jgi:voltage-gated potassium channel
MKKPTRKNSRQSLQEKAWILINPVIGDSKADRVIDITLMSLIALNILAIILETVPELQAYHPYFRLFDIISVMIFSIEYLTRLWSCTVDPRYRHPVTGRLKYMITPMALIDLLAILPFYLPMFIQVDLRFLRGLRLIRIFRVLKMGRYTTSLQLFSRVLQKKKEEILITLFLGVMLLILASSLVYLFEHEAQPDKFPSIPSSMWWGAVTLTTIGYGDVFPITPLGKILGATVAVLGIGMFALPTAILGAGFMEELANHRKKKKMRCPNCRKVLDCS